MIAPLPSTPSRETATIGWPAKADRAKQMLAAYKRGASVSEIAESLGVTRRCVHLRLNDLGVGFERGRPDDLWSLPEDERRKQIILRSARGAREALKQTVSFPHRSPPIPCNP